MGSSALRLIRPLLYLVLSCAMLPAQEGTSIDDETRSFIETASQDLTPSCAAYCLLLTA